MYPRSSHAVPLMSAAVHWWRHRMELEEPLINVNCEHLLRAQIHGPATTLHRAPARFRGPASSTMETWADPSKNDAIRTRTAARAMWYPIAVC